MMTSYDVIINVVKQGCKLDVTKTCPGQTDVEYRSEFSMWAIMASSLLVATDIKNMSDTKKEVSHFSNLSLPSGVR